MSDYEIRYMRRDGTTSLVYRPNCIGDHDAHKQALAQCDGKSSSAEIWNDLECVEVIVLEHAA
jgi:hypothetical protein